MNDLLWYDCISETLCRFLAMKSQLPRKYLGECDVPTCGWEGWNQALKESSLYTYTRKHHHHNPPNSSVVLPSNATAADFSNHSSSQEILSTYSTHTHTPARHNKHKIRIVLSYSHNGFGNQLWEHTVAFMVAEGMKARLLIGIIPEVLCFDGATPPNTFAGMSAMERLLPDEFEYDTLPSDSWEKQLCEKETFFVSDRPRDWR